MRYIRTRGSEIQSADTCYVPDALKRPFGGSFFTFSPNMCQTGRVVGLDRYLHTIYPAVAGAPTPCASQYSNSGNFSSSRRAKPFHSRFERLNPGCHLLARSALAAQTRLLVPVRLPHIQRTALNCKFSSFRKTIQLSPVAVPRGPLVNGTASTPLGVLCHVRCH